MKRSSLTYRHADMNHDSSYSESRESLQLHPLSPPSFSHFIITALYYLFSAVAIPLEVHHDEDLAPSHSCTLQCLFLHQCYHWQQCRQYRVMQATLLLVS